MENKRVKGFVIGVCLSLILMVTFVFSAVDILSGSGAEAQEKPQCVTDKCHSNMGKEKFVHGPAATGDCVFCHVLDGKHKFKKIADVGALCYDCHDKLDVGATVHPPVAAGQCTGCHDPHQSPNQFQLKGAGSALCFNCHDKTKFDKKFVHGPVAVGGCSICHNPHVSDFPRMLMGEGNDVCFSCHSDKEDSFKEKKFVHKPVQEACVNCHSPHGGDFEFNFTAEGSQALCFTCHTDKEEHISQVKVPHGGLTTERKCLACHEPHVSNFVKNLLAAPMDLCMQCHDREYTDGKHKVADMKEILATNSDHHGPIRQKDCSACHNTHGSNNFRILRAPFPDLFYSSYNPENYAVCFMCHENTIARDARTTTLTNFRNGDQNLHFVHVNKKRKGRTCRACHDAHATKNPRHVRDAVPFGKWPLPVNFKKTETGGTCLPGCHQLFKYDRNKAVFNR